MSNKHEIAGASPRRTLSNVEVLAFVWHQWMRRPYRFALVLAFMLAATGFDLSIPWAAGRLVGVMSAPARRVDLASSVWGAWAALSSMYVFFYLLRQVAFRLMNGFSARNMEEIANDLVGRVLAFSSDWYADTFAGSTARKVSRGMWGYLNVSDMLLTILGPSVIVLFGLSLSMAMRMPSAGAVEFALIVIYMVVNVAMITQWIRPANLKSNAADSGIGGALADAFSGNAATKSFGAEEFEQSRFAKATAAWRVITITTWNRFTDLGAIINLLLVALQAVPTGLIVRAWTRGEANSSDVAFAISSFMLMTTYLRNFSHVARNFQKGIDDLEDIAAFEMIKPEVADRPGAPNFVPGKGEIVFDRVTFRYKSVAKPIYEGFSVRIAPGERLALVGPTGAGKSTFFKLIQRLYDIEDGHIRIDGQDVASVTQRSLRRAIAVVPQDPALFHRTVAENIAYARPDATLDEIVEVARRASAHDFISSLPKGYDTLVGERGVKLSGGERQRVAIARAFLADAPILLFDEATSSLDVHTEREIRIATEALMVGRTSIVITHRLSTIRSADRILVFSGGRVIEEGRHRDLVEARGIYARLQAVSAE